MCELALLRGGPFDISKLKEIVSNFSLFLIRLAIVRQILDAEMKDETPAGVGLKANFKKDRGQSDCC